MILIPARQQRNTIPRHRVDVLSQNAFMISHSRFGNFTGQITNLFGKVARKAQFGGHDGVDEIKKAAHDC
jgi:hypothetical protein